MVQPQGARRGRETLPKGGERGFPPNAKCGHATGGRQKRHKNYNTKRGPIKKIGGAPS